MEHIGNNQSERSSHSGDQTLAADVAANDVCVGSKTSSKLLFAKLRNARIAFVDELPEKGELDVDLIRRICGLNNSSKNACKLLYIDEIDLSHYFLLIAIGNFIVKFNIYDDAFRRRYRCVYFNRFFRDVNDPTYEKDNPKCGIRDNDIEEKIIAEGQVLPCLIEGAKRYYDAGGIDVDVPLSVREDTQKQYDANDEIYI